MCAGPDVPALEKALLAGVQLTRVHMDQLCALLDIETSAKAKNSDVIQSIIQCVSR